MSIQTAYYFHFTLTNFYLLYSSISIPVIITETEASEAHSVLNSRSELLYPVIQEADERKV